MTAPLSAAMSAKLTDDYAVHGYAVLPNLLSSEELSTLRYESDIAVETHDPAHRNQGLSQDGRIFAYDCQRRQPALRSFLFGDLMAGLCAATLGPNAYFFLDQFAVKMPDRGSQLLWHQDSAYVRTYGGPADHSPYLTCWIPLDDVSLANGTLRVQPATHRSGILPHTRQEGSMELVVHTTDSGKAIEVPAGSIVLFSSLLLHSTGANLTETPRRAYLAQYTSEVLLNAGTLQLRRNAIPILLNGRRATLA